MDTFIIKDGKRLRMGYTTGSCAAAAAKAAAWMLLTGRRKEEVYIDTPKGIRLQLKVTDIQITEDEVSCAIVKDGGDDPDVTTGFHIQARVARIEGNELLIDGGEGVGRVTKRGLDQPVGNAAINSVPRRMIRENLEEVMAACDFHGGLSVLISVPGGEALAQKTFNPRMGIVGGISILGTTGIVEPMSEKALTDTILLELKQRRANGADFVLLTPGNYGADFIRDSLHINPALAVQTSNYIGEALDMCAEFGFKGVVLIGHIGKLIKLAGGMFNTHSKYGDCRMEIMAAHAGACGLRSARIDEMMECAACDDGIRILREEGIDRAVLDRMMKRIETNLRRKAAPLQVEAAMFSKEYGILGQTRKLNEMLERIREE